MVDAIAGLSKIRKSDETSLPLNTVMDQQGYSAQVAQASDYAVENALSLALTRPTTGAKAKTEQEPVVSGQGSPIDRQKEGIVSDKTQRDPEVEDPMLQEATMHTKQLYIEMGRWSMAWNVAKRIQRDTSQLLSGQ